MKLKELQEVIKNNGIAVNEDILKVESFINHQVDPHRQVCRWSDEVHTELLCRDQRITAEPVFRTWKSK